MIVIQTVLGDRVGISRITFNVLYYSKLQPAAGRVSRLITKTYRWEELSFAQVSIAIDVEKGAWPKQLCLLML